VTLTTKTTPTLNTTMKTTVILFKAGQEWTLMRYKGDMIPTSTFATAKQAREFAKKWKWGVKRSAVCDNEY
jgi:hypothetical protein